MTDNFSEDKWNTFESSGRIADYLSYKGIGKKTLPRSEGVSDYAHNNGGNGDILAGRRG